MRPKILGSWDNGFKGKLYAHYSYIHTARKCMLHMLLPGSVASVCLS